MGSRSSTASTNSTSETTTNNVDNRVAEGDASIGGNINLNFSDISTDQGAALGAGIGGSGGGAASGMPGGSVNTIITTSDFGALDAASELADSAFEFSNSAVAQLGAVTSSAVSTASESAKNAVENITRDESARTTQIMIVAAAVVGVALFIRMRSK